MGSYCVFKWQEPIIYTGSWNERDERVRGVQCAVRERGIKLIKIKGEVSEHSRLVSLISNNAIEIFVVSFGLL